MKYKFSSVEEKLDKIKRIIKTVRKIDKDIREEEPCCMENMEGEKDYCLFHGLLHELEKVLEDELHTT